MARATFDNYGLTELRRLAREAKIPGRSKMDGWALLVAMRTYWTARRIEQEEAVLPAVKVGAILRHKSAGYLIRVTGDVYAWEPYGARCVPAEYVTLDGWGDNRKFERAAYQNTMDAYRAEQGNPVRHPLWQYGAVGAQLASA